MVTFKTVIIATLNSEQLNYLKNLATEHDISFEVIVEEIVEAVEEEETSTPITAEMLGEIATATSKTVLEVATLANEKGITTVEDALASSEIPSSLKEILENYL